MSGKLYNAACYCRLSQDDANDGTSVSIITQKEMLRDYCVKSGYSIHDFYCDDGYTGTNFDRPAFQRMYEDAKSGLIDIIVVKDLSRFGRNQGEVRNNCFNLVAKLKIRMIFVSENLDSDDEEFFTDLKMVFSNVINEIYPLDTAKKVRVALRSKAERGEFIGSQAPYGYIKSPADKHVLIVDPETAPVVAEIFELYAYKGYGYNSIAKLLSSRKQMTPAALQAKRAHRPYVDKDKAPKDEYDWHHDTIRVILNNEVYLGTFISGKRRKPSPFDKYVVKVSEDKWIKKDNHHEPLIDRDLWDAAHSKMDGRRRTTTTGFVNIFTKILKCECCGKVMGMSNFGMKDMTDVKNIFYVCNTYKKKGKDVCSSHYIRYDALYETVLEELQELLEMNAEDKTKFKQTVERLVAASSADPIDCLKRRATELEQKLTKAQNVIGMLYADRVDGKIDETSFTVQMKTFQGGVASMNAELAEVKQRIAEEVQKSESVDSFVDVLSQYEQIDHLDQEMLSRLIEKIEVFDATEDDEGHTSQKIRIYYRFIGTLVK